MNSNLPEICIDDMNQAAAIKCKQDGARKASLELQNHVKMQLFTKTMDNYQFPDSSAVKCFWCMDCGDRFALKSAFIFHMQRSSVRISQFCTVCKKMLEFLNRCQMLSHMRSHVTMCSTINLSCIKVESLPPELLALPPLSCDNDIADLPSAFPKNTPPPTFLPNTFSFTQNPQVLTLLKNLNAQFEAALMTKVDLKSIHFSHVNNNLTTNVEETVSSTPSKGNDQIVDCNLVCLRGNADSDSCPVCKSSFVLNGKNSKKVGVAHFQKKLAGSHICYICDLMLPNKCALSAHTDLHFPMPRICPECGSTFEQGNDLQKHLATECFHFVRCTNISCGMSKCAKVIKYVDRIKHYLERHTVYAYKCIMCAAASYSLLTLKKHMKTDHNMSLSKGLALFKCIYCYNAFLQKGAIEEHLKIHSLAFKNPQTVFHCPGCSENHAQLSTYRAHIAICNLYKTSYVPDWATTDSSFAPVCRDIFKLKLAPNGGIRKKKKNCEVIFALQKKCLNCNTIYHSVKRKTECLRCHTNDKFYFFEVLKCSNFDFNSGHTEDQTEINVAQNTKQGNAIVVALSRESESTTSIVPSTARSSASNSEGEEGSRKRKLSEGDQQSPLKKGKQDPTDDNQSPSNDEQSLLTASPSTEDKQLEKSEQSPPKDDQQPSSQNSNQCSLEDDEGSKEDRQSVSTDKQFEEGKESIEKERLTHNDNELSSLKGNKELTEDNCLSVNVNKELIEDEQTSLMKDNQSPLIEEKPLTSEEFDLSTSKDDKQSPCKEDDQSQPKKDEMSSLKDYSQAPLNEDEQLMQEQQSPQIDQQCYSIVIVSDSESPKKSKKYRNRKRKTQSTSPNSKVNTSPNQGNVIVIPDDGQKHCAICEYETEDVMTFRTHILKHRDVSSTAYQCMECGQTFVGKSSLGTHLIFVHAITNFNKYIEENGCYNREAIKMMKEPRKSDRPVMENQCSICYQQFDNAIDHDNHFRVHGMAFLLKKAKDTNGHQCNMN